MLIKNIEEYNIPDEYRKLIIDFYRKTMEMLKDIILLFVIGGCCGREAVHQGWSDIDILIVLKEYKYEYVKKLQKAIFTYQIKVGTTIYSQKEFEVGRIDGKTMYTMYLLENDILKANYYNDKLKLPVVTLEMLQDNDSRMILEAEHKLKRLLHNINLDKKSIIKTLALIMKVNLIKNEIIPIKYEDIFYNFAKQFNIEYYDISKDLNKDEIKEELILYAIKVIELISN
mgnify:FL=1